MNTTVAVTASAAMRTSGVYGQEVRGALGRLKQRVGCAICGYNASAVALDFNHFKGAKRADITKMVTYSWTSIRNELAKCVVLCANCHRRWTHGDLERGQ